MNRWTLVIQFKAVTFCEASANQNSPMTSPFARVPSAFKMLRSRFSLMNRAEPSHSRNCIHRHGSWYRVYSLCRSCPGS